MENSTFDAIAYFYAMTESNKLAREKGFVPVTISNTDNLEGLMEEYRDNDRFVAITDTNSGNLSSADGAYGFMKRRAYTVFILSAYEYGNMQARQKELELCRELLEINPRTNVVYLTAYSEYSLDAWSTGAIGFLLKPITPEGVREQLKKLRYPFRTGGEGA